MNIIEELEKVIEKHKDDFVGTWRMNWVEMARDCVRHIKYRDEKIKELENELKQYEQTTKGDL